MTSPTAIIHPSGVSRTIFVVAIIVVAVISGVSGYVVAGYFRPTTSNVTLNGAGATFPYPFISAVSTNYTRIHCAVAVNYQSIGSGGGVKALTAKTVDFAASDAPLSDAERTLAPNALHIPETVGSVVLAYNLPGIPKGLNITGDLIAKIFLGTITKWNDSSIKTLNAGFNLPGQAIQVVHRSDGSGTTFVWTSYLSLVSPTWNSTVGHGKSVSWPVGLGSAGNEGVAGVVRGTTYTVGYVELAYALTNNMAYAYIQNPAGKFIQPSVASTAAAFNTVTAFPTGDASWSQVTLLNSIDPNAYPIASLTYTLVYKELNVIPGMTQDKARALGDFLWFMIHDGQNQAAPLGYVTLSAGLTATDEATIRSITFGGTPVHP